MSSISEFDSSTIYQQVQADLAEFKSGEEHDFSTWFENLVNILDTNAAGHLQNEIDAIEQNVSERMAETLEAVDNSMAHMDEIKIDRFSDGSYTEITGIAYDKTHKKLGLRLAGADSVIPFSSGAKLIGTYSANASVNVSNLGATSVNQFVMVPTGTNTNSGFRRWATGGNWTLNVDVSAGGLSLSGNTLTVNIPYAHAYTNSGNSEEGYMSVYTGFPVKVYYIGNIY